MAARRRSLLGWLGLVLGTPLLFVLSLVAAVLLHIDHALTKQVVQTRVNQLLSGLFLGTIEITKIDRIRLVGVSGVSAVIRDPEGIEVIAGENVSANLNLRALLGGLSDGIHIELQDVHVERARFTLAQNAKGEMRIATVFTPRDPSPPSPGPSTFHFVLEDGVVDAAHYDNQVGLLASADLRHIGASVAVHPERITVSVPHAGIHTHGVPGAGSGAPPADVDGFLSATVALPAPSGESMALHAGLEGAAGGVPLSVVAALDGMNLLADVRIHDPTGDKVKALVPPLPRAVPVDVHVTAHGAIAKNTPQDPEPQLQAVVHARAGSATVSTFATLALNDRLAASALVRAEHVDLAELVPDAPKSNLGAEVEAHVALASGGRSVMKGDFVVNVLEGMLAEQPIPTAKLEGTFEDTDLKVKGVVNEPGAPITLDASIDEAELVRFSVRTPPIDLASQRRIPKGIASGRASVRADGQLRLSTMALDAHARVDGSDLASSGATAKTLAVDVRATGTARNPQLAVRAEGSTVTAPTGMAVRKVVATTQVAITPTPTLRDVAVAIDTQHSLVKIGAKQIRIQNGVHVDGVRVEGLGQPIEGEVSMQGQRLVVKLHATDVDLSAVGHILASNFHEVSNSSKPTVADPRAPGVVHAPHAPAKPGISHDSKLPITGRVSLDVDLVADGRRLDGHADISARELDGFGVKKGTLALHGSFQGDSSGLTVDAAAPPFGKVKVIVSNLVHDGPVLQPSSWERATFGMKAEGTGTLAALRDLRPDLPLTQLNGTVALEASAFRSNPNVLPDVDVHLRTEHLEIALADMASRDVDVEVGAALTDGKLHLAVVLVDPKGTLARVAASSDLPAKMPARIEELADHPLQVQVHVPRRAITDLPSALGIGDLPGRVQLALSAWGTLREPRMAIDFDARGVSPAGASNSTAERRAAARRRRTGTTTAERSKDLSKGTVFDTLVRGSYDGEAARVSVMASSGGRNVLDAQLLLHGKVRDLLTGGDKNLPFMEREWDASARVAADELPLEWIPVLGDLGVRGQLGGELLLDGFHKDAKLKAAFRVADLRSGRVRYKSARIDLSADARELAAHVDVDQEGGFLRLAASSGVEWGKRIAPKPREDSSLHLALDAYKFRVAAIQPFVSNYLQQLDGKLDADLDVELKRHGKFTTKGQLVFSEGVVQTPFIGDEFRDVGFRVVVTPDGIAKLENFVAHPTDGEIQGSAAARFEGASFKGADAQLKIPKQKAIELAVAGLSLGQIYGDAKVAVRLVPSSIKGVDGKPVDGMLVDMSVPNLSIAMPGIPSADVQKLARPEGIRIGTVRAGRFVPLPLDGSDLEPDEPIDPSAAKSAPTVLQVSLGNVDVKVGELAQVSLTGKPKVTLAEDVQVEGQIQLKSGAVDVQGKKFAVESGVVTFAGTDPSNPTVVARAAWTAQDQTRVIAEYVGPVKTGKVELRSEPPRPKNEVLALVLFGTADGMGGAGGGKGPGAGGQAGMAVAGQLGAAQGLGQAMTGLTGFQTQARVDTSTKNPRPELEVQVSRTVSVGFQQVLGTPPASEPDTSYGKFSWRFAAHWSLVTTIGNKYSTLLDAIWRYRY